MDEFKEGGIVMVKNFDDDIFHTQKFVMYHNNTFYCERDDGDKSQLIGWDECIENQGHEYIHTGNS